MKKLENILIPTDFSEHSRRAVVYGCWLATEQRPSVMVLHVANELRAGEFYSDEFSFVQGERIGRLMVSSLKPASIWADF